MPAVPMAPSLLYHISQMSTIADLRAATWPSHQRLERRLDVKARFSSAPGYREHLEQMWGFCAALESRIEEYIGAALEDFESRRKMPLLRRDLSSPVQSRRASTLCPSQPSCDDTADALGCLYVLEGATLGGRTLLPMVAKLGRDRGTGREFLASYGEQVEAMWRGFRCRARCVVRRPAPQQRARDAAVATFESLSDWLCGDLR